MARSFARSISFPLSPSRCSSKPRASAYHERSVSLPCRPHNPALAHLQAHILGVRAWAAGPSAAIAAGLELLASLHASLADLLALPEAQAALLPSSSSNGDRLLDAFLRLADAHGCFQETLLALKRDVAEALAAVRRRDGARLASAVRSQRRAGKELARLASLVRPPSSTRMMSPLGGIVGHGGSNEFCGVLMEAAAATAAASAALFGAVAAMSASVAASASASACSCKRTAALVCLVKTTKTKGKCSGSSSMGEEEEAAMAERLEELEECVEEMEAGGEKVFRSLVQTRVSLLNIHTTHIF
ncbi:uncharacterized protein LOC100821790 [Brachypodium distachyon]|uniref:Uncharacterized protein n=1 Tax=Brachypodium distachyon TaxID=15368 RepID=I1GVA3_BRADI|nr:uncharacterized protein LOC100821790 [Brachypodium distachyon]KQK16702.1 hypothetical protein BRADI_1g30070v3 [Brachypodium distachyon]|eukprot:XP_003563270.1 uncharacterized protein LOC100821790 [Brachypodium distachyon]